MTNIRINAYRHIQTLIPACCTMSTPCDIPVVNKTQNGTEWNGMEKVNKTRNGTAESAQSTPTHPWPTELHPRKLFVHAERFAHSFSWKRMGRQADYSFHSRQTI